MKLGFNPTLVVEASITDEAGTAKPLAGQVFYISERSPDGLLRENDFTSEIGYARTMNALRISAFDFCITDSRGKAEIKDLKAGIYYICGIGHTNQEVVIWNIRVELKSGKNNLVLNNENMMRA
jgi:hypothetical protein